MDIILISGLWFPSSIWDDVVQHLQALGHRPAAIGLPGVDDTSTGATLDDQVAAVLSVVDETERPLVVGHSAAATLAWMVADRRPDDIAGVVMIGGFPHMSGSVYADFFPVVEGVMAFPGWEPFEGPDSDDLDDETKARLAALAVPVPGGVAAAEVTLSEERRYACAVTVVCPEFDPAQAKEWLADGHIPELAAVERLDFVDIDSGHWPMVTRPGELARLLGDIARR